MEKKYDAIIIGAGIIGCCIAFELMNGPRFGHELFKIGWFLNIRG